MQAVEDALRTFGADEIVVVTRPDAEASWLEGGSATEALRRFGLPVTHLVADENGGRPREPSPESVRPYTEEHERRARRGRGHARRSCSAASRSSSGASPAWSRSSSSCCGSR